MFNAKQDHYLAGKLLLAMPNMVDIRFHKAVIFICAHDENGAMGLVINNIIAGIEFRELLDQLKIESDIKVDLDKLNLPIMRGGPVEAARGFLLHSSDFIRADTMKVGSCYGVTGTVDALKDVVRGTGPKDLLFALGYAGWEAGQLDEEIRQNAWLVVDPDDHIIFKDSPDKKWKNAINKLGIVDPAKLSYLSGRA